MPAPERRRDPLVFVGPDTRHRLGELAAQVYDERFGGLGALREPELWVLEHLIGPREHRAGDLLSYLFFDRSFIDAAIALGSGGCSEGDRRPRSVDKWSCCGAEWRASRRSRSRSPRRCSGGRRAARAAACCGSTGRRRRSRSAAATRSCPDSSARCRPRASRHGFAPVLRAQGGRAAAYDEGCLVIDEIMPASDSMSGIQERFAADARAPRRHAAAPRRRRPRRQVPGEYCPGPFTVNARGERKLAGSAQRLVRGGWLLSTVIVVTAPSALRAVLTDVYDALGLDWDPATVGAVADEAPGGRVGRSVETARSSPATRRVTASYPARSLPEIGRRRSRGAARGG